MRAGFVEYVVDALLDDGTLKRSDSVLAVCAGMRERDLLAERGFSQAVITNLEPEAEDELAPFEWAHQDAQALRYEDRSFDFAIVVAGLHHCASPHRALVEMYRVSRKGILAIEARDGLLLRAAIRLGLASEYELEAVIAHGFTEGGVDNTPVPNFIYRWTEAEFEKTIRSFDPSGEPAFRFFYSLGLPRRRLVAAAGLPLEALARVFPKVGNTIAMVALRPREHWPWLTVEDRDVVFDRSYVKG